jgi:uncharacterized delta-60 repeat protein
MARNRANRRRRRIAIALGLIAPITLTGAASPVPPGHLDPAFGEGGVVVTEAEMSPQAIVVTDDDRLVVAGYDERTIGAGPDFAVARFTARGRLDPGFGIAGRTFVDVGGGTDIATALARYDDGRLVVAGSAYVPDPVDPNVTIGRVAVARLRPDGTLDGTFGADGTVAVDVGGFAATRAVAVQRDGKVVVVAFTMPGDRPPAVAHVLRFLPDGRLDPGFGTGGIATPAPPGVIGYAVTVGRRGAITVAGEAHGDMALFRLDRSGRLDDTFGTGGIATLDGQGALDAALSLAQTPAGDLVAGGYAGDPAADPTDMMVARVRRDGTPDRRLGGDGTVVTDIGGLSDIVYGVAVQPDGKIVAAGSGGSAEGDGLVARFRRDGRLDGGFGDGGVTTLDVAGGNDDLRALARQSTGRIVVAGTVRPAPSSDVATLLAGYAP